MNIRCPGIPKTRRTRYFIMLLNMSLGITGSWGAGQEALFIASILFIVVPAYLLPTIIAFKRKHRNRYVILVINLALGGTVLAWLGALIWALNRIDDPVKGGSKYDRQPHDPIM